MKKLFTILSLFVAFVSNAQNTLNNIGLTSSTPASVAYSLRLLSSSYAGPLVRIKVGTSFYDVYPDLSTNKFSLSSKISASISTYNAASAAASTNALSTIISGSTDVTVAIWYDQSGNGVDVLSSSSTAKIITAGTVNTLYGQPTIYFSGSNGESLLSSSNTVNYSAQSGATVNAVAQNVATTSSFAGIIGAAYALANPGYNISYDATIGKGYASDGAGCTYGTSLSSSNPQVVTNIFVNTTTNLSNTYINGVLKTSSGSTCSLTHTSGSKIYLGSARGYGPASFIGNISEAIIFPKQLADAERNPLEANQTQTYFSPVVTITSSASGSVCAGTNITFTANAYNFTTTPTYQWYKNNTLITGATSSTYSTTTLSNNDQINVSCATETSIVSDATLALLLDAKNGTSISGNTWSDLSGKGNHATLTSDQSYSNTDGGIIQFNGGQNAVSMPLVSNKNTGITMQTWVYLDATTKGPFFKNGTNNGYVFGTGSGGNGFEVGNKAIMLFAGARWIPTTTSYGYGWKFVTMTINSSGVPSLYINGTLVGGTYTGSNALTPNNGTYLGRNVGDDDASWPKFNGKMGAAYFYTKELSQAEIVQNYNATATRYGLSSTTAYSSNTITATVATTPSASVTVTGDACANKTTLSTTSGLTAYAWYKDDVAISGATSNSYTPTASGAYKVFVTSGSCSSTSTSTTIYTCGRTADGKMSPITSSTTLVTIAGEINSKYGVDERGLLLTKPFANTPTSANPVTSGLILYLDATRSASYGGSGTTWADISGLTPAGSATLVGSPVFGSGSTSNGSGSFTFGSNINASTTKTYTIDNEITYIAWVNPSTNFDGGVIVRRTDPGFGSGATSLYLYNNNLGYDWDNQNWGWRSNLTVPNNQWSMIVITVNSSSVTAYLCNASGIASVSSGRGHSSLTSKGATNFFIAYDPYSPSTRAFKGKMGTAMVYSVALSSADISSIYNAQKAAFGL